MKKYQIHIIPSDSFAKDKYTLTGIASTMVNYYSWMAMFDGVEVDCKDDTLERILTACDICGLRVEVKKMG